MEFNGYRQPAASRRAECFLPPRSGWALGGEYLVNIAIPQSTTVRGSLPPEKKSQLWLCGLKSPGSRLRPPFLLRRRHLLLHDHRAASPGAASLGAAMR